MGFLIWLAVGLILDFMFGIQHYVLERCFKDIFSPQTNQVKRINMLMTSIILYVIAWPLFIIATLVLKLKETDEDYEE
jgi:lipopolysaccharide/colanic/teichoic acid biosynthesis glycosyltransferase